MVPVKNTIIETRNYCLRLFFSKGIRFEAPVIILSFLIFYLLLPLRIYNFPFYFTQAEEWFICSVVISFVCLILVFNFLRKRESQFRLTILDILVFSWIIYIMFRIDGKTFDFISLNKIYTLAVLYTSFRLIKRKYYSFFFYLFIACNLILILLTVCQSPDDLPNLPDAIRVYQNTGIWGGMVCISLIILYGLLLFTRPNRFIAVGVLIVLSIQLICTQSRAAWVATVAGILFLMFTKISKTQIRKSVPFLLFLVPLVYFAAKGLYDYKPVSADGRLFIWKTSLPLISRHPFVGSGLNSFQTEYMYLQADYLNTHPDSPFNYIADDINVPFNEPLKLLIEQGIIGLFFLLTLIFCTFFLYKHTFFPGFPYQSTNVICRGVLVGLLVFSCFSYPSLYIQFGVLLFICLAISATSLRVVVIPIKRKWLKLVVYPSMLLIILISGSSFRYLHYSYKWQNAILCFNTDKSESIQEFGALYPIYGSNPNFLFSYARALSHTEQYAAAIRILDESLRFRASYSTFMELGNNYYNINNREMALKSWETASGMVPSKFRPIYMQIKLYHETGNTLMADSLTQVLLYKKKKRDTPQIQRMLDDIIRWRNERYPVW